MDTKVPTIEALDAAFKAHKIKNIEDREKDPEQCRPDGAPA
jgi:hypothetical protein